MIPLAKMSESDDSSIDEWIEQKESLIDPSVLSDIRRRDFMKASGVSALTLLGSSGSVSAASGETASKTRVTLYTEEERRAALDNIRTYDWAEAERDARVKAAETILGQFTDLEDAWTYVGSQNIPRRRTLAPGEAGYPGGAWNAKYGIDADTEWTVTESGGKQWKVTNGEWTLPTNDFEAYRESGRDDEGQFDPELADDGLLVNEEHPEMGETWGVDDGTGFVDEDGDISDAGKHWAPVAWAHHWNVIYGYRSLVNTLFEAYLYTGDERYARPVSVILDRLGDVYADFHFRDGFSQSSTGGTGQGKQVGSIWESYWVKSVLRSYDAVWPAQTGDDELVTFLQGKTEEYPGLASKGSVADIRENIETGFVQEILPAVKNAQIRGNFGSHQATLAISAVLQDEPDGYTGDAIDWLFKAGDLEHDSSRPKREYYLTGGDVLASVLSEFDRDGWPNEASPHYNSIVVGGVQGIADVLNGYDAYEGADLYENPLLKNAFQNQHSVTYLNEYVPSIGDSGGTGKPGLGELLGIDNLVKAYETYGNDELAQWSYLRNGRSVDGLQGDIFDPDPQSVRTDILETLDAEGPLDMGSRQLAGYGFTGLRAGDPEAGTDRGVWTYYGRNHAGSVTGGHPHRDTLNLGVFAHGMNLAPDLGYPDDLSDPKRWNWTGNTVSHNTVVVNERRQDAEWVAKPKQFDHTDRVQLSTVDASNVYSEADQYERTTAQITVDEENSYAVDFFRIDGGDDHHFSFHGAEVPTDSFEYNLKNGVSEFVVRPGSGEVKATQDAFAGDTALAVADPSGDSHNWRGLYVDAERSDVSVETYIKSAVTGYNFYWHHNHSVYLGQNADGRHVVAGVGNQGPGHVPRMGIYYPETNDWGDFQEIDKWAKDEWFTLSVSKTGTTVDVALTSPDGSTTHSSGSFSLTGDTDTKVGIYGGIGKGQTGNLYFDEFTLDGSVVEFFDTEYVQREGVRTNGLNLTEQNGGTYAGEDVPYGDNGYNENNDYSGFNYLYNVERDDDPDGQFSADWDVSDTWDARADDPDAVHLRLTMLTDTDDVAIASGDAIGVDELKYLLAHREGSDLQSVFTSVVEPYKGSRFVESVSEIPVESDDPTARAVQVELSNGRTDYIASASNHELEHRVGDAFTFVGTFAVYSTDLNGAHEHAYINDGKLLIADGDQLIQKARGRVEGTVEDFTDGLTLDNQLQVRVTSGQSRLGEVGGSWIYADVTENDGPEHGPRNGAYEIRDVETGQANRATLDVGEQTTVKDLKDPKNPSAGYEYVLEKNGMFAIPLSANWSA